MSMKGVPMPCAQKEEKLFGFPKYEVENLADTIMRAKEAESTKPGLYDAALKVLGNRAKALGSVLKMARRGSSD